MKRSQHMKLKLKIKNNVMDILDPILEDEDEQLNGVSLQKTQKLFMKIHKKFTKMNLKKDKMKH